MACPRCFDGAFDGDVCSNCKYVGRERECDDCWPGYTHDRVLKSGRKFYIRVDGMELREPGCCYFVEDAEHWARRMIDCGKAEFVTIEMETIKIVRTIREGHKVNRDSDKGLS